MPRDSEDFPPGTRRLMHPPEHSDLEALSRLLLGVVIEHIE